MYFYSPLIWLRETIFARTDLDREHLFRKIEKAVRIHEAAVMQLNTYVHESPVADGSARCALSLRHSIGSPRN